MIKIEVQQEAHGLALLHLSFRPFFLGAAAFSIIATVIWMAAYTFGWETRPYGLPAMTWHAHEMIYGYAIAVVAGFLLTAIKNWTGIQTLNGPPLLLLFLLWVMARALPFIGAPVDTIVIAVIDNLFIVALIMAAAYPVIKARQWRQLAILLKLLLLLGSNVLFYLGVLDVLEQGIYWGLYSGLYLIMALIFTIGRRVIPFFIERGVGYPVQLKNWKWLDISSLVLFLLFWIADLLAPNGVAVAVLAGILWLLHTTRMVGWYTHGIWRNPLLWVLYLAYGSLVAGFLLKLAVFVFGVSPYLALHAFAFGGIGMMTIGMMSRVSLGHTARSVTEPPAALFWVFLILFIGVVARVLLPLIDPSHHSVWVGLSQVLWIVSFSLFLYVYTPMLFRLRVDGRYG
ncbi:MAG: NnrS family protein [Gammaproteobacteria bacterium]|nr:MAG: NnrS family protein [Gammaproteobacteria bacterium]